MSDGLIRWGDPEFCRIQKDIEIHTKAIDPLFKELDEKFPPYNGHPGHWSIGRCHNRDGITFRPIYVYMSDERPPLNEGFLIYWTHRFLNWLKNRRHAKLEKALDKRVKAQND